MSGQHGNSSVINGDADFKVGAKDLKDAANILKNLPNLYVVRN